MTDTIETTGAGSVPDPEPTVILGCTGNYFLEEEHLTLECDTGTESTIAFEVHYKALPQLFTTLLDVGSDLVASLTARGIDVGCGYTPDACNIEFHPKKDGSALLVIAFGGDGSQDQAAVISTFPLDKALVDKLRSRLAGQLSPIPPDQLSPLARD